MRFLGVILLLAGLGLGVIWPMVQVRLYGNELARLQFAQLKSEAAKPKVIELSKVNNPVRVSFEASYLVGAKLPPVKIPVKVLITDADGALLSGKISFSTKGDETGPEQPKVRGSQSIEFNVLNEGEHLLYLSLAPNKYDDGILVPDIAAVTAIVIGNAPELRDDHKALAAVLVLAGMYVLIRSRRNRKGKPSPPKRWGRGEEP